MSVKTFDITSWEDRVPAEMQAEALSALENGKVVYLPALNFSLSSSESKFLAPEICGGRRKNIGYDIKSDQLGGFSKNIADLNGLKTMLRRYALHSQQLVLSLFPQYANNITCARTSFRPVEIAGRIPASYRKDDTRLHVDSFPASPTGGKRILRVFSNINPEGAPRVWRIGESFREVVAQFAPRIKKPAPGFARLLQIMQLTRGYRTWYDHYMLKMHDMMKKDLAYQQSVAQTQFCFPPGSTWLVYTDQVSHAAMSGQYVFEQTFHLPVHGLSDAATAPISILKNFLAREKLPQN